MCEVLGVLVHYILLVGIGKIAGEISFGEIS
jgi:hypothetical protein